MGKHFFAVPSFVAALLLAGGSGAVAQGGKAGDRESHSDLESESALVVLSAKSAGSTGATGYTGSQVGRNVRVNAEQILPGAGLLGRSETTVASDATGLDLVAGFNDAQGFCGPPFGAACTPQDPSGLSGYAFSTNGGATWIDGNAPPQFENVFTRGDPWLARGGLDENTFFYANLAVDATTGVALGVSVHRGHFHGSTFAWDDVRVFNAPAAPDDFYDKEAIAVDQQGRGLGIVSLTNFVKACGVPQGGLGQIEVWRTADGGDNWEGPTIVSPDRTSPACDGTGTLQQSSAPAITPTGDAYVAWQFGPSFTATGTTTNAEIRVAHSSDGGATFSTPVTVAAINSMRQDPPVGYNRDRINDHPRIAVAISGPHAGRVFVSFYSAVAPVSAAPLTPCPEPNIGSTCRGQNLTSSQIFLTFSDDKGRTWSTPTPLAPAPPSTGVKRLWPVVTVGTGDNVDVVYYESEETANDTTVDCNVGLGGGLRRLGPAHSFVDTFIVHSSNGGATFGDPVQVSSATSDWCTAQFNIRPNFGDYIGSGTAGTNVFPVWADSRTGPVDTFFAPVAIDH